jgi:hypothetical protein
MTCFFVVEAVEYIHPEQGSPRHIGGTVPFTVLVLPVTSHMVACSNLLNEKKLQKIEAKAKKCVCCIV